MTKLKNQIDGIKEASELLAGLDGPSRERILKEIAKQNPQVAEKLKKNIFTFEDVLKLIPQDLYKVLQNVSPDLLVLSLRGLEPSVLDQFFKGFSERQGKTIREEMLAQGPRKLSDVKAAQDKLIEVASELNEKGEIKFTR